MICYISFCINKKIFFVIDCDFLIWALYDLRQIHVPGFWWWVPLDHLLLKFRSHVLRMVLETHDEFFHTSSLKTNLIHRDKQWEPVHTHTHTPEHEQREKSSSSTKLSSKHLTGEEWNTETFSYYRSWSCLMEVYCHDLSKQIYHTLHVCCFGLYMKILN